MNYMKKTAKITFCAMMSALATVFMLIAFGLTFGADIICIAVWGYEGWLESPFGLIVTLTMFAKYVVQSFK